MANAWKCDQCGRVEPEYGAVNWLRLTLTGLDARSADNPLTRIPAGGLHFCSLECLTAWTVQTSGLVMHHGADRKTHVMTPVEHRIAHEEGR